MNNIYVHKISDNPLYSVEVRSSIGGRSEQQDTAFIGINNYSILAAVCDGMGGTNDGGAASRLVSDIIRSIYTNSSFDDYENPSEFLYHIIEEADKSVSHEMAHNFGGTTLLCALITKKQLFWCSVGDSRLYIARDGDLIQATRDHNYRLRLDEMKRNNHITFQDYESELKRSEALISYIGIGNISLFDLTKSGFELSPRDSILLTTDGLYNCIPIDEIGRILTLQSQTAQKADIMLDSISHFVDPKAQDNSTFILIEMI